MVQTTRGNGTICSKNLQLLFSTAFASLHPRAYQPGWGEVLGHTNQDGTFSQGIPTGKGEAKQVEKICKKLFSDCFQPLLPHLILGHTNQDGAVSLGIPTRTRLFLRAYQPGKVKQRFEGLLDLQQSIPAHTKRDGAAS